MAWWLSDGFSSGIGVAGSVASLVALCFSVFVAGESVAISENVKAVKEKMITQIQLNESVSRLDKWSSEVKESLEAERTNDARDALVRILGHLQSHQQSWPELNAELKAAIKTIEVAMELPRSKNSAAKIACAYREVLRITERLRVRMSRTQFGDSNG